MVLLSDVASAASEPPFTGVSDPYEPPSDAEITIDTSKMSANEAAATIVRFLQAREYL